MDSLLVNSGEFDFFLRTKEIRNALYKEQSLRKLHGRYPQGGGRHTEYRSAWGRYGRLGQRRLFRPCRQGVWTPDPVPQQRGRDGSRILPKKPALPVLPGHPAPYGLTAITMVYWCSRAIENVPDTEHDIGACSRYMRTPGRG